MADIIDFQSRLTKKDAKSEPAKVQESNSSLIVACSCGQTLHELLANCTVRCSRCGSVVPIKWQWTSEPPTLSPLS